MTLAFLGACGAALVVGGYWFLKIRPRARGIWNPASPASSRPVTLEEVAAGGDFDLAYELSGSILGLGGNGDELIAGDRGGGVLRIRRAASDLRARRIAIADPVYRQNISLHALTWNGAEYVGLTTGDWFQRQGEVFTLHDPATLEVTGTRPAPPLIGCLAWDGRSYWAATRKQTEQQGVDSLLYKLDRDFNVVSTATAPGAGCQGMLWDGRHLWLADVFSDAITIVDPNQSPPKIVHSLSTPLSYLSGLASFENEIWVTEYGENRLRRLRPAVRAAWTELEKKPEPQLAAVMAPQPVYSDRAESSSVQREPEGADVISWSIELRDGGVYGSWRIWFGHSLFAGREQTGAITLPQFARYTVTVRTPWGQELPRQFDASAGENTMEGVRLCDARAPGQYSADVFVHAQYVAADGTAKILNLSGTPLRVRR